MNNFLVADYPRDWPLNLPNVTVVSARDYLANPDYGNERSARVYNLCKSYRYQSLGYYVSLLAEARGHRPLPRAGTIEDMQSQNLVRFLAESLDDLVQRSLAGIEANEFELSSYFGRDLSQRHDPLARQIFDLCQAPLLRAHFVRHGQQWHTRGIHLIAAGDLPPEHQEFAVHAATTYFLGHSRLAGRRAAPRRRLAILYAPDNPEPASNAKALRKFEKAAAKLGMRTELITRADFGRLGEFDALFIRDTTFAHHYTYRFSRQAAAQGMVVIDDPDSILKCNNKVYLAELLARHRIPAPKTLLVHKDNVEQIVATVGLPCVLKRPDSSFSRGVSRADTGEELRATVKELLAKSELIIAQEYLPTEFDWRVGIIDRRPLFACKYYMAPGHWQIVRRGDDKHGFVEGATEAVPLDEAPEGVVKIALKAANLIGDGFYGVDVKQLGKRLCVIEINDNPNVDAGNEDGVLKDALYREVMAVFAKRIEARRKEASR